MAATFPTFGMAQVQLASLLNCRHKVGTTWAERLRPKLHALAQQIPGHKGMIFNDLGWEWAFFDAHKKLLLGKVDDKLQRDLYLTELPLTDLVLFEQGRYEVALTRPVGDGSVDEQWLQRMKGPGLLSDHQSTKHC